ncbi:MAG: hypothetical protein KAT62_14635, partial [Desulfuromonadales bacterium]|nr:hypothetical protein [Desulfuromonadales bacterium]
SIWGWWIWALAKSPEMASPSRKEQTKNGEPPLSRLPAEHSDIGAKSVQNPLQFRLKDFPDPLLQLFDKFRAGDTRCLTATGLREYSALPVRNYQQLLNRQRETTIYKEKRPFP